MLVRSIMVRRLVPADQQSYDADPVKYFQSGEWLSDPKDIRGEAIVEKDYYTMGPDNQPVPVPHLGVCWENVRRPAIEYVPVSLLENVDNLYLENEEEEEEEDPAEV